METFCGKSMHVCEECIEELQCLQLPMYTWLPNSDLRVPLVFHSMEKQDFSEWFWVLIHLAWCSHCVPCIIINRVWRENKWICPPTHSYWAACSLDPLVLFCTAAAWLFTAYKSLLDFCMWPAHISKHQVKTAIECPCVNLWKYRDHNYLGISSSIDCVSLVPAAFFITIANF